MSITIVDLGLKFKKLAVRRATINLIIHHAAAVTCTVQQVHQWHLKRGWAGIGYNFYVRKDGTIYKGRGWEHVGSHCSGHNSRSIGICFEGNYDSIDTTMPQAQYRAGVELIREALRRYPTISNVGGHRNFGTSACPGRYFPLAKMITEAKTVAPTTDGTAQTNPYKEPATIITSIAQAKAKSCKTYICKGEGVKWLQWSLVQAGYKLDIDGACGAKTVATIIAFQRSMGLVGDGLAGRLTRELLK